MISDPCETIPKEACLEVMYSVGFITLGGVGAGVGVVIVVDVDAVAEADAPITHWSMPQSIAKRSCAEEEILICWAQVLRWGVETARVKDSGKVDMSSQVQLGLAVTVQDRSSSVETVLKAQVMALDMSVVVQELLYTW